MDFCVFYIVFIHWATPTEADWLCASHRTEWSTLGISGKVIAKSWRLLRNNRIWWWRYIAMRIVISLRASLGRIVINWLLTGILVIWLWWLIDGILLGSLLIWNPGMLSMTHRTSVLNIWIIDLLNISLCNFTIQLFLRATTHLSFIILIKMKKDENSKLAFRSSSADNLAAR